MLRLGRLAAALIHGAQKLLLLTVDSKEDFVQVPNIAEASLTPLQSSSTVGTEYETMISRSARKSSTFRKLRQS